jgi:hypothetical protein
MCGVVWIVLGMINLLLYPLPWPTDSQSLRHLITDVFTLSIGILCIVVGVFSLLKTRGACTHDPAA